MSAVDPYAAIDWSGREISVRRRAAQRVFRWRFAVVLLPAVIAVSGCGESQVPVYPVSGRVTYQGKPAAGATVVLHALGVADTQDVAPYGVVENDGTFAITVYEPGDGAPQGDYVATVEWRKLVANGGGAAAGPNVLPRVYANPKTSPVKVSVANGPVEIPPITIK
jgi:hypothetical protein